MTDNKGRIAMQYRRGSMHVRSNGVLALHAGTFHSLAAELLRSHISKLGHASRFSIMDDEEQKAVLRNVLRKHCRQALRHRLAGTGAIGEMHAHTLYSFLRSRQ